MEQIEEDIYVSKTIKNIFNKCYMKYKNNETDCSLKEIPAIKTFMSRIISDLGIDNYYNYYTSFFLTDIYTCLDYLGESKNIDFINFLISKLSEYLSTYKVNKYHLDVGLNRLKGVFKTTGKLLVKIANKNDDINSLIEFYCENRSDIIVSHLGRETHCEALENFYNIVFPEELRYDPRVINAIIKKIPSSVWFILEYVKEEDRCVVLDSSYSEILKFKKSFIRDEEMDFVYKKARECGSSFVPEDLFGSNVERVLCSNKYNFYNKIRSKYGKSYEEFAKKNGIDPTDKSKFIYNILTSNVLKEIYSNGYFNKSDTIEVDRIIDAFKKDNIDCTMILNLQKKYMKEVSTFEIGVNKYLVVNRDNKEALDKLVTNLHLDKDNFFNYIKDRKFMDSVLKNSSLLILSKYFNTNNYISVYDIIDLLQEMTERGLTIDEIIKDKELDRKTFYSFYKQTKDDNPLVFEAIRSYLSNNKMRGFKKLLKLYYAICSSNITDYDSFIKKFGFSPEDALNLFDKTKLYDDVYKKLSSWYNYGEEKIKNQSM